MLQFLVRGALKQRLIVVVLAVILLFFGVLGCFIMVLNFLLWY
jgi:Cu/Ag efflux pump CusA